MFPFQRYVASLKGHRPIVCLPCPEPLFSLEVNAIAEAAAHAQRRPFGSAGDFPEPVVQADRSWQIANRPFAAVGSNNQDAGLSRPSLGNAQIPETDIAFMSR